MLYGISELFIVFFKYLKDITSISTFKFIQQILWQYIKKNVLKVLIYYHQLK